MKKKIKQVVNVIISIRKFLKKINKVYSYYNIKIFYFNCLKKYKSSYYSTILINSQVLNIFANINSYLKYENFKI